MYRTFPEGGVIVRLRWWWRPRPLDGDGEVADPDESPWGGPVYQALNVVDCVERPAAYRVPDGDTVPVHGQERTYSAILPQRQRSGMGIESLWT